MVYKWELSLRFAFFMEIISFEAIKGYEPTICIRESGEDGGLAGPPGIEPGTPGFLRGFGA